MSRTVQCDECGATIPPASGRYHDIIVRFPNAMRGGTWAGKLSLPVDFGPLDICKPCLIHALKETS